MNPGVSSSADHATSCDFAAALTHYMHTCTALAPTPRNANQCCLQHLSSEQKRPCELQSLYCIYTFPFAFIDTVVIHEKQRLMTFSYHHFLTCKYQTSISLDCIVFRILKFLKCCFQASEMVPWVKVAAKPEELSLTPRIHMAEGESTDPGLQ